MTDASCARREVWNQQQVLQPEQVSLLTRLLGLPSHHAAFRGATGLAKNAKNLGGRDKPHLPQQKAELLPVR